MRQKIPPARIELATPGLGNLCSIQLSYGGICGKYSFCAARGHRSGNNFIWCGNVGLEVGKGGILSSPKIVYSFKPHVSSLVSYNLMLDASVYCCKCLLLQKLFYMHLHNLVILHLNRIPALKSHLLSLPLRFHSND
jgi:hypothetical protein